MYMNTKLRVCPIIGIAEIYSYPIIHVGMIDSAYILRPHRGSSYVTNLSFGFQIAERMGHRTMKTGCR